MSIGSVLGSVAKGIWGALTSKPSSSPAPSSSGYGYSGSSSFEPASKSSGASGSGGAEGDKDWFKKAVMRTIVSGIEQSMDRQKEDWKRAYKDGL